MSDHKTSSDATPAVKFSREWLTLNPEVEISQICARLRETVLGNFHKQGCVIGISGGIDSSIVLALAAKALGANRVLGVILPEKESSTESIELAINLGKTLNVQTITEYISSALEGFGCYQRRDEAINRVISDYMPGWGAKIILPADLLEHGTLNLYRLVVTDPSGQEMSKRLSINEYQQIVASSNFKQRSRMSFLYYYAETRNYVVLGTANKNEHDLGFFVKWGDGGMDINPIQHLYKTQVYQLAKYLNIPEEIQKRVPTTDTYPGGSTQEEFFYRIPFDVLDTIWLGYEKGVDIQDIADVLNFTVEQVSRVISDIQSKKRSTEYLRMPPLALNALYSNENITLGHK